uniref:Uncharacterized protein n=1 Tax=Rhodosorus marinus TaxID=101924 RepID=A0A7S2ZKV0_9RHOD
MPSSMDEESFGISRMSNTSHQRSLHQPRISLKLLFLDSGLSASQQRIGEPTARIRISERLELGPFPRTSPLSQELVVVLRCLQSSCRSTRIGNSEEHDY